MRAEVFGDEGEDVVFVLGWTNRPEYENVRWLIDRVVEAGYRVHAVELPRVISDFDAEFLGPVRDYAAALDGYRLLAHSAGGLVGAFLEDPVTRVYLSPWWGFNEELGGRLLPLLLRLPTRRTVIPAPFTADMLGDLAREDQLADLPDGIAPTFLREAKRAQGRLPPVDPDAVVFYCPDDPIGSAAAILARTPGENAVAFEGGHDLFNCSARAAHLDTLLAAVESGADALA